MNAAAVCRMFHDIVVVSSKPTKKQLMEQEIPCIIDYPTLSCILNIGKAIHSCLFDRNFESTAAA